MTHNAHVLKWIRWQHFMAVRERRYFAQAIWAKNYEIEKDDVYVSRLAIR